jgi:electron transport complex protein RnfG
LSGALRVGALLAVIAIVGAGVLAGTKQVTAPAIQAERRADRLQQLQQLLPPGNHDNDLLRDTIQVRDPHYLGTKESVTVYRARRDGEPMGLAFRTVAPKGYNGAIHLLVAIRADGGLAGVRVLRHSETPGLGDQMETSKSPWLGQFTGRSLGSPPPEDWKVVKDGGQFEALTGATITSRAVIKALQRALRFYEIRGEALFRESPESESPSDKEANT